MPDLNEWRDACHKYSCGNGFWDDVGALKKLVTDGHYRDNKTPDQETFDQMQKAIEGLVVGQKLALINGEVGEALEAHRKGRRGCHAKDTFEDELADIFIRLMDLCGYFGIDIQAQVEWKHAYNQTRPFKHGKAY